MNKKAIAILGAIFLLIVGTLGFLIYSKYGGKTTETPPVSQGTSTTTPSVNNGGNNASSTPIIPPAPTGPQFIKIIPDPVVSPVLFFSGKGVTYFNTQGQLFQASFDNSSGQVQVANSQALDIESRININKILWPKVGDNFIAEFRNGDQLSWSFYDSQARVYTDLPSQIEAVDWMPDGSQILSVWLDKGKATLNISDPGFKTWKNIGDMWETDDQVSLSPDGKNILYYERNNATSTNPINLVTVDGKMWKTLVKDGFNTGVLWSPDSQKFLFAKRDRSGSGFQLWYYNVLTDQVKNLALNTTVEKAAWGKDSQSVLAAVPASGVAGGETLTVDSFFKVDAETLVKKEFKPDSNTFIDGRNLFLNDTGDTLFFKNAQDGALYYLNLNQ